MQQSWSHTYAPVHGQPNIANGTVLQNAVEPQSLLFNSLNAAFYRQSQQNTSMSSNPPALCLPHLSFPVDQSNPNRSFLSTAYPASYPVQQIHQTASGSQSMQLPHQSINYAPNYQYLSPQMVQSLSAGFNQCSMPTQPQSSLQMQSFDSAKHFGSLQHTGLRRNRPIIISKTNLYVSGLFEYDNDETLRSLVDEVVSPKSCKAMMINDKCKGFGFIDCATEDDAERAKLHIENLRHSNGRKLSVKYAFENEKDAHNVYVRNLPKSCNFTKTQLEDLFRCWGCITSAKILEKESGPGVGFVRFSTETEAANAIEGMNRSKRIMPGNDKPVTCKLADKADPNRRSLAAARASQASGAGTRISSFNIGQNHYLRHGSVPNPATAYSPTYPTHIDSNPMDLDNMQSSMNALGLNDGAQVKLNNGNSHVANVSETDYSTTYDSRSACLDNSGNSTVDTTGHSSDANTIPCENTSRDTMETNAISSGVCEVDVLSAVGVEIPANITHELESCETPCTNGEQNNGSSADTQPTSTENDANDNDAKDTSIVVADSETASENAC